MVDEINNKRKDVVRGGLMDMKYFVIMNGMLLAFYMTIPGIYYYSSDYRKKEAAKRKKFEMRCSFFAGWVISTILIYLST